MHDHNEPDSEIDHGKTGRPPMQPRAKATREAILEASATLFSKTGYAGTSINDILAISQSTKGAMYFHFSKKEFSVRFRQLHQSSAGDPDFSKVANILEKHARTETDSAAQDRRDILEKWRKGRARLLNRNLKNIVAHMVLAADDCPNPAEHANYEGLNPTELIGLFNYGELIHFGKHSAEYEELAEDGFSHDFKQHAFMVSMLGLIHLYFGYAELIRKAIADA